nr:putative polyketide cyclase [Amycolatopsis sp.]
MDSPAAIAGRERGAPAVHEVADHVYAYVQPDGGWCLNNAGIVAGGTETMVIDTAATEARTRRLSRTVEEICGAPPKTVVNTHHHGDHTHGNSMFAAGATIIGHERARTEIAAKGLGLTAVWPEVEWGRLTVTPPTVTFTDRLTVHVGETEVRLRYVGPAHTTNDIVAWLPRQRVLFAGDVVLAGATPFCLMGSVAGTLDALRSLRELGARTVVPGHGPVCGPEVFDVTENYLRWLQRIAAAGVAAGLTPAQLAADTDLGEFAGLTEPERLVANLHRAYAELRGEPRGTHIASAPVFAEMTRYHGGRTLTCHA